MFTFWQHFTVEDAIDFLLYAEDSINMITLHAWWLLVPHLCASTQVTTIQPLATLLAVQGVPELQDITLQEEQQPHSAEVEQDPKEVLHS